MIVKQIFLKKFYQEFNYINSNELVHHRYGLEFGFWSLLESMKILKKRKKLSG